MVRKNNFSRRKLQLLLYPLPPFCAFVYSWYPQTLGSEAKGNRAREQAREAQGPGNPQAGQTSKNKKRGKKGGGRRAGGKMKDMMFGVLFLPLLLTILPRMLLGPALCPALSFFSLVVLAALSDNLLHLS